MDKDMSIELSRARHLVDVLMELVGDLRGLDACETTVRERACSVLACVQRELQEIEAVLYPNG